MLGLILPVIAIAITARSEERLHRNFARYEPRVEYCKADLSDSPSAARATAGVNTLFYTVGVPYPQFQQHPKLTGVALKAAAAAGVRRYVKTTGTCSLYAPAMPLIALRAPTPCVTIIAPMPLNSCVCIRRVGGIELVTISDPGRLTAVFELLHECKVVIARHAENVPNTSFLKAAKQKVSNRLCHNAYLLSMFVEFHPIDRIRGILNPHGKNQMELCDRSCRSPRISEIQDHFDPFVGKP